MLVPSPALEFHMLLVTNRAVAQRATEKPLVRLFGTCHLFFFFFFFKPDWIFLFRLAYAKAGQLLIASPQLMGKEKAQRSHGWFKGTQ